MKSIQKPIFGILAAFLLFASIALFYKLGQPKPVELAEKTTIKPSDSKPLALTQKEQNGPQKADVKSGNDFPMAIQSSEKKTEGEEAEKIPLRTRMDLAAQQEFKRTVDPALGRVPRERLYTAWQYMKSQQNELSDAAIAGVTWDERGPNNVGGRTRAILVDPND
jgi:hypothetical protein